MTHLEVSQNDDWQPKYLHFLSAALVTIYLVTNVIASKQAELFGVIFTMGTLTFPFVLVLGDIISEVYGYKRSRQVIFTGFAAMVFFVVITQITLLFPSAPGWGFQQSFTDVLGVIPRIIFASLTTYIVSDLANSYIMTRMKVRQGSGGFQIRAVVSTVVAQAIDGLIFYPLAFYGIIPTPILVSIFFTSWVIKVGLEVLCLPVTTLVVKKVKRLEGVEHFDSKPIGQVALDV